MRRIARRPAIAASIALAVALWLWHPADARAIVMKLSVDATAPGHQVEVTHGQAREAGRTWGFWGAFTGLRSGSYRATCTWLANQHWGPHDHADNRLMCTLVLSFKLLPPSKPGVHNGGSIVAEGLIAKPAANDGLFVRPSKRRLAITGGTGPFDGARGSIGLISTLKMLDIAYTVP